MSSPRRPEDVPLTIEEVAQLLRLKIRYRTACGVYTCDACSDWRRRTSLRNLLHGIAGTCNLIWLCDDCAGQQGLLW